MDVKNLPWIRTALNELGTKEIDGVRDNPRIIEYHQIGAPKLKAQSDEVPWCAAFVGWVLYQHNIKGTGLANARSYLQWGEYLSTFRPGCVVIYRRGNSSWQGHVGFALEKGILNIKTLGGNQSDMVSIANYSKSKVLGYRWHPAFTKLSQTYLRVI